MRYKEQTGRPRFSHDIENDESFENIPEEYINPDKIQKRIKRLEDKRRRKK